MAATGASSTAVPTASTAVATGNSGAATGADPQAEFATNDEVKEFCHEGDGENTEHLNSMDLSDIKSDLKNEADVTETPNTSSPNTTIGSSPTFIRPVPMVYNGFMMPQFAGTPIYPMTAAATAGMRPVKVELPTSTAVDWTKTAHGISLPYGYPTAAGFVSMDQTGIRPATAAAAYPFIMPGQYVTQVQYPQQLSALGTPIAPNAAIQPNSGIIAPQSKEKKPHIKKPLNAFMLFMKEKRADVIKECTLKESAAINQILGKMWHQLDKTEQARYYEMAREERAKHLQMYPGWSARDNYAVHKKRKKRKIKQQQQQQEVDDDNPRKCRARYGMEQQHMWCGPCRRKKKCIKANDEGDEPEDDTGAGEDDIGAEQATLSQPMTTEGVITQTDDTNSELLAQVKQEVDDSGLNSSSLLHPSATAAAVNSSIIKNTSSSSVTV